MGVVKVKITVLAYTESAVVVFTGPMCLGVLV